MRPQLQYLAALMITIKHNEHIQHLFDEEYKPTMEHTSKSSDTTLEETWWRIAIKTALRFSV
jgi:ribulose bisphosphate carboxylase small subunit